MTCRLVALGSSWGGFEAVANVLRSFSSHTGAAVVIAQHRAPGRSTLAGLLSSHTGWLVGEVEDKEPIVPGRAYLAPGGYHLLVEEGRLSLSTEGPVSFSRPSIDVLFESAAAAYGPDSVGVILTGSNRDGAAGLAAIAARGGSVAVQDPNSAQRSAMPLAALAAVPGSLVLALAEIGPWLSRLCPPASAVA